MDYLNKIKSILSISDSSQDTVINDILELIKARLQAKTQQDSVPEALGYIVVEASISRFNRINDEGKQSASESEVSATYQTDDLAPFADDIADWVAKNIETSTKGKFTFY
ncbi:phage head-tail connector protein [Latilactobacillus sakei]